MRGATWRKHSVVDLHEQAGHGPAVWEDEPSAYNGQWQLLLITIRRLVTERMSHDNH